jgi:hypothetical protein
MVSFPPMRSPGLVVMGVVGLLVVGYAFYVLLAPPPPRSGAAARSRAEAEKDADEDEGEPAAAEPRRPRAREAKGEPVARPTPVVDATRPKSGPPPRPEPAVSLAVARKQYADFMAELDRLAAGDEEITSPEWVELYKRGHEVLLPLQQHLDWQVPEQARELKMANEDMRARLDVIDPNRPDPPPAPP